MWAWLRVMRLRLAKAGREWQGLPGRPYPFRLAGTWRGRDRPDGERAQHNRTTYLTEEYSWRPRPFCSSRSPSAP